MQNWQQIIWHEWRNTSDLEYAEQLFELVADTPVGWGSKLSLMGLGGLAGAALGIVLGAPITLQWTVLQQLALAGCLIGAVRGYLQGRQLLWRDWLKRLESNTPTDDLSRLVGGALLLGLLGGLIFGPPFWLVMAGLFWSAGGLITWLNRSIDNVSNYNPEDRRWWFWWRSRPHLIDLQAALQHACSVSPVAGQIWGDPLRRLAQAQRRPAPPQELIKALLFPHWTDRFVARHTLIMLGTEAEYALETAADNDHSPLQQTLQWLLKNIRQSPTYTQAHNPIDQSSLL